MLLMHFNILVIRDEELIIVMEHSVLNIWKPKYAQLNLLSLKKGESTSKWVLICTFNAERKIVIDPD